MTGVAVGVLMWAAWLAWHGRRSSPRKRREWAQWEHDLRSAAEERPPLDCGCRADVWGKVHRISPGCPLHARDMPPGQPRP